MRDAESFFQRGLVWSVMEEHYFKRKMEPERRVQLDRSIVDLTKAIEIDPAHAKAYGARGVALLIQGREAEGKRDFDLAIKLNSDLAELLESRMREVIEQRSEKK
ncbi:MAG: tetratricopeptide repeat protein [Pyrinomonadaceae bacterium]